MSAALPRLRDERFRAAVKRLLRAGWCASDGAHHVRVRSPCGRLTITVPGSPSDRAAYLNWRSQVRRAMREAGVDDQGVLS